MAGAGGDIRYIDAENAGKVNAGGKGNLGKTSSDGLLSIVDGLKVIDGKIGGKIPIEDFHEIRKASIHNADADSLTLGKYTPTIENGVENWSKAGPDSYIAKAGTDSMYFDLGNDWSKIQKRYNLTDDEMFEFFNVPALDDAVKSGKEIRFSHDPRLDDYKDSYLKMEWDYLQEKHGYSYLIEEGGMWYAG